MPHFGAALAVGQIDLASTNDEALRALRALVYARGLVVVPGQAHLSPAHDLRVAKAFNHTEDPPGISYTGGAAKQHMLPPPLHEIAVIGRFELRDYHGLSARADGVYEFSGWGPSQVRQAHITTLYQAPPLRQGHTPAHANFPSTGRVQRQRDDDIRKQLHRPRAQSHAPALPTLALPCSTPRSVRGTVMVSQTQSLPRT